ncbi:MAG: response regulator [Candidatus Delongbacteria bacterium]|nr:response regulator [Candidatus Delongbacteria bacterium]MBN2834412.1 response regulator [Candidatus Delongbacteria bacterium]
MRKRILIADDSSTVRKFVLFTLKVKGFEVIAAVDGMDAMEKMPADGVDLIITDLNMPNMDGYEFIRSIRADDNLKSIPIIILSSESKAADKEKGMQAGANSYLVKPFNALKLQYEVAKYIN